MSIEEGHSKQSIEHVAMERQTHVSRDKFTDNRPEIS